MSLLVFSMEASAQIFLNHNVGIINDKDAYVLVRSGKGTAFSVVDTINTGAFFQFLPNDSISWVEVLRWNLNGFVHNSRIQDIKALDRKSQRSLLASVFKQKAINCQGRVSMNTNEKFLREKYHEDTFVAVLDMFISYNAKTFDEDIVSEFFDILILDSGSADETPSWVLGYIYLDHPDKVISLVRKYNNSVINNHLDFGFMNVSYQKENEIENYEFLNNQIQELFKQNPKQLNHE